MTGDNASRRAEDVGGQELSYAEVKAIASGNPAVLTLSQADAELQRLAALRKNHFDEQFIAHRRVRDLPAENSNHQDRLTTLTADQQALEAHHGLPVRINERPILREDISEVLERRLEALPSKVFESKRIAIGTYRGLTFGIVQHPDAYLEGTATRITGLNNAKPGPRAVMNALERLANTYGSEVTRIEEDLKIAQSQLHDYRARLASPFAHDAYMQELTQYRNALKESLSGRATSPPTSDMPSTEDLATSIRHLITDNVIDAPQTRT